MLEMIKGLLGPKDEAGALKMLKSFVTDEAIRGVVVKAHLAYLAASKDLQEGQTLSYEILSHPTVGLCLVTWVNAPAGTRTEINRIPLLGLTQETLFAIVETVMSVAAKGEAMNKQLINAQNEANHGE